MTRDEMSYTTSDVALASFLLLRGYTLVRIEAARGSPRRGMMVFEAAAKDGVEDYYRDGAVSARIFASTLRELKARIRSELQNS